MEAFEQAAKGLDSGLRLRTPVMLYKTCRISYISQCVHLCRWHVVTRYSSQQSCVRKTGSLNFCVNTKDNGLVLSLRGEGAAGASCGAS